MQELVCLLGKGVLSRKWVVYQNHMTTEQNGVYQPRHFQESAHNSYQKARNQALRLTSYILRRIPNEDTRLFHRLK